MKRWARNQLHTATVISVAQKRMPNMTHMDANLVRAACLQLQTDARD